VRAAADARNRVFTLLTRRYDQVRRAVVFLRWDEGDADRIVPSLYKKHRGSSIASGHVHVGGASFSHPLKEAFHQRHDIPTTRGASSGSTYATWPPFTGMATGPTMARADT